MEVDLTKPLISIFEFKGKYQKISYERLPKIFFNVINIRYNINYYRDNPANVNTPPSESVKVVNFDRGGGDTSPIKDNI